MCNICARKRPNFTHRLQLPKQFFHVFYRPFLTFYLFIQAGKGRTNARLGHIKQIGHPPTGYINLHQVTDAVRFLTKLAGTKRFQSGGEMRISLIDGMSQRFPIFFTDFCAGGSIVEKPVDLGMQQRRDTGSI